MATTLNMTLLLRRAAFADTCVLALGEPGYHTGTKEFKIGDGSTPWANLKLANETQIRSWISDLETALDTKITANTNKFADYYTKTEIDNLLSALRSALENLITAEATARQEADAGLQGQLNTKLATETFNGHVNGDHAKTATEISAEIDADVAAEAALREAADKDITDTLGTGFDKGDNTVAKKIAAAEAAAKAHAEEKATKAYTDAVAEAENKDAARATTTATNLANAVSALETKITNGDSATLQSAQEYTDEKVAAEAKLRSDADNALNTRLEKVEAFFEGAAEDAGEGETLINALDTLKEIQDFATGEGTAAQEMLTSIAQNASDIDALESRMSEAEGTITSLGNNKVDKSAYDAYIAGKELSDDELKSYADNKAGTAKSEAINEATRLDGVLKIELQAEIDSDISAAISAEISRAEAAYDATGSAAAAQSAAIAEAGRLDATLKTAIEGTSTDESSKATIAGAKKYAEEKAAAAEKAAKDYADSLSSNYDAAGAAADAKAEVIGESGDAKTADTIYGAKAFATDAANTAKQDAIDAVVGTANDGADTDTINGVRKAFAAADVTTLTSAQTYADTVAANAVKNNIKAGNNDIVINRPDSGDDAGKTIISHKVYGSGTYTKPDSVNDANFVTGVTIENGHVTGASVKSLAEALAAMTFIFDGGTSADTITNN